VPADMLANIILIVELKVYIAISAISDYRMLVESVPWHKQQ